MVTRRAAARRRLDLEPPVERVDAVAQPAQPAARRRVGAADPVVADAHAQAVVVEASSTDASVACAYLATLVSASAVTK